MKKTTKALIWIVVCTLAALWSALLVAVHVDANNWFMAALMVACFALNVWTTTLWVGLYRDYKNDEQQDHPF